MMKNFAYYRPRTKEEAVGLLDSKWGTTELLAGGTDLLDLQKQYIAQPDKVISIKGVGLTGIKVAGDSVQIGAGTKLAEIAEHAELQKLFPAVTIAAGDIGGPYQGTRVPGSALSSARWRSADCCCHSASVAGPSRSVRSVRASNAAKSPVRAASRSASGPTGSAAGGR